MSVFKDLYEVGVAAANHGGFEKIAEDGDIPTGAASIGGGLLGGYAGFKSAFSPSAELASKGGLLGNARRVLNVGTGLISMGPKMVVGAGVGALLGNFGAHALNKSKNAQELRLKEKEKLLRELARQQVNTAPSPYQQAYYPQQHGM